MGRPGDLAGWTPWRSARPCSRCWPPLQAGDRANEALYRANEAVLQQTRAVDSWSQFQADSVKKYQASTLVTLLPHLQGTAAELRAA